MIQERNWRGHNPTLACVHCGQRITLVHFQGPYDVSFTVTCRNPTCGRNTHTVVWEDDTPTPRPPARPAGALHPQPLPHARHLKTNFKEMERT